MIGHSIRISPLRAPKGGFDTLERGGLNRIVGYASRNLELFED